MSLCSICVRDAKANRSKYTMRHQQIQISNFHNGKNSYPGLIARLLNVASSSSWSRSLDQAFFPLLLIDLSEYTAVWYPVRFNVSSQFDKPGCLIQGMKLNSLDSHYFNGYVVSDINSRIGTEENKISPKIWLNGSSVKEMKVEAAIDVAPWRACAGDISAATKSWSSLWMESPKGGFAGV